MGLLNGVLFFISFLSFFISSGFAKSPSGGYSPGPIDCPSDNIVRPADVG